MSQPTVVPNQDDVLGSTAAARELEVSPEAVRLLAKAGKLRHLKTTDGHRIFFRRDVEALKAEREKAATR